MKKHLLPHSRKVFILAELCDLVTKRLLQPSSLLLKDFQTMAKPYVLSTTLLNDHRLKYIYVDRTET
jgi:hypothetical protein